jgi:hypothetical protein
MFISIGNAAIVLFFEFVLLRVRCGIATPPEGFNKIVALSAVAELAKSRFFFWSDDVPHIILQPLLIGLLQLCRFLVFPGTRERIVLHWFSRINGLRRKHNSRRS